MYTIRMTVPADELGMRMRAMRRWFDQQRCGPKRFTYINKGRNVVIGIEFEDDHEAAAFASRFHGPVAAPGSNTA